jgi:hypothetical protein
MKLVHDISLTSRPMRIGSAFSPGRMFANAETGVWFDPSDVSTLFQDSAGTVPVSADGDPVGQMRDKSGNAHHATQAVIAARPIYRTSGGLHWLEFNGINRFLVTPTITPGIDKVQAFLGITKLSNLGSGMVIEHSADLNASPGSFYIVAPVTSGAVRSYGATSRGSALSLAFMQGNTIPSPSTNAITFLGDIGGDNVQLRADGVQVVASTLDQGSGDYTARPLFIGMRGGVSLPFLGRLHGLVLRFGPVLSEAEIARAERFIAAKSGATL